MSVSISLVLWGSCGEPQGTFTRMEVNVLPDGVVMKRVVMKRYQIHLWLAILIHTSPRPDVDLCRWTWGVLRKYLESSSGTLRKIMCRTGASHEQVYGIRLIRSFFQRWTSYTHYVPSGICSALRAEAHKKIIWGCYCNAEPDPFLPVYLRQCAATVIQNVRLLVEAIMTFIVQARDDNRSTIARPSSDGL